MPLTQGQEERLKAPFPAEKVNWKPQTISKDGTKALAVAYIDARDVAARLDEVVGPMNWQVQHEEVGGEILTSLGIYDEEREGWIWKQDVGVNESKDQGMALKGKLSDGMKRAAVLWGIGRILYELPAQWVGYDQNRKRLTEAPKLPKWWGNESVSGNGNQLEPETNDEQSLTKLREKLGEHSLSEIQFLDYVNRKAGKEWGELEELPQAYISKALERFGQNGTEFQIEIMESAENA